MPELTLWSYIAKKYYYSYEESKAKKIRTRLLFAQETNNFLVLWSQCSPLFVEAQNQIAMSIVFLNAARCS